MATKNQSQKKPNKGIQERSLPCSGIRAVEGEERTFELSFSSEEPYTRWFGVEILDHTESAVDLSRLKEIGVVLYNHNRDDVIGKILTATVVDSRGVATIQFDDDELSEKIRAKVESGTLKGVSVGYSVDNWEEVAQGKKSTDGKYTGPCYVARKWMPYEISIVSVPADATVGVGRELDDSPEDITGNISPEAEELQINQKEVTAIMGAENKSNQTPVDVTPVQEEITLQKDLGLQKDTEKALADERTRVSEIMGLCKGFDMDPEKYITDGSTIDQVRAAILDELKRTHAPIRQSANVTADEQDKFRAAAVDGLMSRAGVPVSKPAEGAENFRGTSLRDLAIECLTREGENMASLIHKSNDDLFEMVCRQFYNPTAAFPAIMDATIKKGIVELYNKVPTTFQQITTKGSLSDFKTTADHEYLIGGVGDFLKVPENGEIKPDMPRTELLPQRKLDTYGKQFSMTRQAFINDDIGFLTRVPGLYATAAKKTIDKQVYSILFNNPAIYDGKNLFHADHKNLIGSGAAPSQSTIQAIILQMQKQVDQFGEPIYMVPKTLVVPMGYEFVLSVIFNSAQVTGSANNDINPLYNYPLQVVQSPLLNAMAGANACPWFLLADETSARGIQVDYLNGQETPTVRRMETVGQLGFTWDIWLDWGIAVRDFRGIYKNPGTTL